jgi:hypothetical protein
MSESEFVDAFIRWDHRWQKESGSSGTSARKAVLCPNGAEHASPGQSEAGVPANPLQCFPVLPIMFIRTKR